MNMDEMLDEITIEDGGAPLGYRALQVLITVAGSIQTITSAIVVCTFFLCVIGFTPP